MKSIRVALLAMTLTTIASGASANLITNGSFEAGVNPGTFATLGVGSLNITNWDILQDTVDYIGSYWVAAAGVRSVDLSGNQLGKIGQTFATVAGQNYIVRFAMAGNPDGGPQVKALVAAAGAETELFVFDTLGKTRSNMGWQYLEFGFTATSASTTLSFLSQSSTTGNCGTCFGAALDDVSVNVPEPMALMLLGSGVAAFVVRRRR